MRDEDIKQIMLKYRDKKLTRNKAIKIYCKDVCCAGDIKSWKDCPITDCPLWEFRINKKDKTTS